MAKVTDLSGIQFRLLNASKGAAVRATRAQIDRTLYKNLYEKDCGKIFRIFHLWKPLCRQCYCRKWKKLSALFLTHKLLYPMQCGCSVSRNFLERKDIRWFVSICWR